MSINKTQHRSLTLGVIAPTRLESLSVKELKKSSLHIYLLSRNTMYRVTSCVKKGRWVAGGNFLGTVDVANSLLMSNLINEIDIVSEQLRRY